MEQRSLPPIPPAPLHHSWVKQEALRATGIPFVGFDLNQLINENAQALPAPTDPVPAENQQLLEPYRERLEDYLGFAFFGL